MTRTWSSWFTGPRSPRGRLGLGPCALVLSAVVLLTCLVLLHDVAAHSQPIDELTEVPLMGAMFLAMVWHARRHLAQTREVERLLALNRRVLERERRFIQNASHELRTPITVAMGHADLLRRDELGPVAAEDLTVITDELERLRRLADRLLVLAGAETPGFLAHEPVELDLLVAEVFHRWSAVPRAWRLSGLAPATATGDRDRLGLALDTLVENAVAHTEPGAEIGLGVRREGAVAVIEVADRGSGIPAHELDRIFDRFARVDRARSRGRGGAGLGLSIARALTEAHGGSVRVRSTVGTGSVFELVLPVAASAGPAAGTPVTLPAGGDVVSVTPRSS